MIFRTVFIIFIVFSFGFVGCGEQNRPSSIPQEYRLRVGDSELTFEQQMYYLAAALEIYRLHVGDYPSQENNLEALIAKPVILEGTGSWYGPYAESEAFFYDPWSNRIVYSMEPRQAYDLRSLGKDGEHSGDDVIAREMMPELFREIDKLAAFGPVSKAVNSMTPSMQSIPNSSDNGEK